MSKKVHLSISMKSECAGVCVIPAGVCVVSELAVRVMEQIKLSCGRR